MAILQLVGPFLVVQGILLAGLLRGAVVRPPPSDEDRFAMGLVGVGVVVSLGATLALIGMPSSLPVVAQLGCVAVGAGWLVRRMRAPTHLEEVRATEPEVLERIDGVERKVRLPEGALVAGRRWPKGTVIELDRGVIRRVTAPEPLRFGRWVAAPEEPVELTEVGALGALTLAEPTVVARLPRGPGELRGARLLAARGSRVSPGLPRGVLAEATVIRGVTIPAGSTVHGAVLAGTLEVELAASTEVYGHDVPARSRLRFRGPDQPSAPDVAVELSPESRRSYRGETDAGRLALWRDGRRA